MSFDYSGRYNVWGPPGTGKTTFLAKQVEQIVDRLGGSGDCPVLLCSLTRTAAEELSRREMPIPKQMIGTLHSHAYRQLGTPPVTESMLPQFNEAYPEYRLTGGLSEVDELGHDGDMRGSNKLKGDQYYEGYNLFRAHMIDRKAWGPGIRGFAEAWEKFKDHTASIDFTDMIDQARFIGGMPGAPKVIIADEAQDLSALEFDLLQRWGEEAGALIIAGDPYQALYTWRGAHPEVFLDDKLSAKRQRLLSQSYRVPRTSHKMAMAWVRQLSNYREISYKPTEVEGLIEHAAATWMNPEAIVRQAAELAKDGHSVMIASTCSFMLSPTLAVLRKSGIPFSNPWRTKRGDWNPLGAHRGVTMTERLLDLLSPDPILNGKDANWWTWGQVHRWASVLKSKAALQRGTKKQLAALAEERGNLIAPFIEVAPMLKENARNILDAWFTGRSYASMGHGQPPPLDELTSWFCESMLPVKAKALKFPLRVLEQQGVEALTATPTLHIGTMHSFKGAEADVVILFPDLSPAAKRMWSARGEGRDSVIRTFYVGLTRTKERLIICRHRSAQMAVDLHRYAA